MMALTYFKGRYNRYGPPDDHGYTLNEYFVYRLDANHILLTTRHRAWVILTPREYELFLGHRLEESAALYALLEDLGLILTSRNAKDIATIHCQRYAFLHQPPALFIMVPTNRCNMACLYCHANASSAAGNELDMTEEVLYKTIDFFFSVPRFGRKEIHIEFQGGEPLLRYDLVQRAMDCAAKRAEAEGLEIQFGMVSNLTLMSDEIATDIQRRKNVRLCSSLDGPPSIHDRQRVYLNGKGTHARVVFWSERLRRDYGIVVPFLPTFTVNGLNHEREIVDEYLLRGARIIYLRRIYRIGRAHETCYKIGVTPHAFVNAWKRTLDYVLEKNRSGATIREGQTTYLLGNMLFPDHAYMCLRRPCGCGISQVVVSSDGTIHGCDASRSIEMLKMGNVLTSWYDEIFTSDSALALRTLASETLPECQTCPFGPYCGYCVARGINEHGSPVPNIPFDSECQMYREMFPHLFKMLLDAEDAKVLIHWVQPRNRHDEKREKKKEGDW